MKLTEREAGFIEGYARALDAILLVLTGDSSSSKIYDPMTVDIEEGIMHSYAFNLKDGGRHHPLKDYNSVEEITTLLLAEITAEIREGADTNK